MSQENPVSLWEVTAEERDYHAPLEAENVVDVAIVGAGYTGLSTALHCAEKGLSAQVLEARQIGYGGSGRNVGYVNAASWLPPAKVVKLLGGTYGPRFMRRFSNGPSAVFELIEKHQIRCEVTRNGTIHAAHAPSGLKDLKSRHAEWQRLGEPVDLLGRDEVAEMTGTSVFHGGLLDHRAGTINPMSYCRGLARAALGAGAKISTDVRVTKLARTGDLWHVTTDQGEVRARNVVLGTNAYTDTLWPGLKGCFTPIHYLQISTEPLGAGADHILPGRQGLWDTGQIMFNVRRDARDRLLLGTMGRVIGAKDRGLTHRWARKQIARLFPSLGTVGIEDAWHGQIAMTPDHLPRIHQLEEGLWTAIGYNGRGITTGTLFGQSLADLLTGLDPSELTLPVTDVARVPVNTLATRFYDLAFAAKQAWRSLT